MQRRQGSILATAVSMTAIFLTLIVGAAAYLENSTRVSMSNRWRDMAEEAARSGLDFVLGWGEQNIDRVSKLPQDWEALADNEVLDPVGAAVGTGNVYSSLKDLVNDHNADATQGYGALLGNSLHEYVLGVFGSYVVSFKARIQQYSLGDDMPRQYRIGVVGRVRKLRGSNFNVDADERATIVSERMIMTNVGKEPASRYAALIDYDAVKNWVPGEEVWGPVHINRGYVDDVNYRNMRLPIATGVLDVGPPSVPAIEARSRMRLHVAGSSVGFVAPPNKEAYPIFHEPVSITLVTEGDPTYTNFDAGPGKVVEIDNGAVNAYQGTEADAGSIFASIENKAIPEFGGNPGPIVRKQPVELPHSVRGALSVALGIPAGTSAYDFRGILNKSMPDGLYVPTANWWNTAETCDGSGTHAHPPYADELGSAAGASPAWTSIRGGHAGIQQYSGAPAGGIYIRGNVEVMRMGVNGEFSYYLFQLGYGDWDRNGNGSIGGGEKSKQRRTYAVLVDRTSTNPQVLVCAWPAGQTLVGNVYAGANTDLNSIIPAALRNSRGNVATVGSFQPDDKPSSYGINSNSGQVYHWFDAQTAGRYPFNGVVFVDLSAADPARSDFSPLVIKEGARPLTGNIFALGDPGRASGDPQNDKYKLDGRSAEYVATFNDSDPTKGASKLTIMSAGNIFIQNDIYLAGLVAPYGTNQPEDLGENGSSPVLADCRDLLGLVADKQIVVGLHAPSTTDRDKPGVIIHAAIAALGDPGVDFDTGNPSSTPPVAARVPTDEMMGTPSYRGSFTTEGIMQEFTHSGSPYPEQYNVCYIQPDWLFYHPAGTANATWTSGANQPQDGFPGNPIYQMTEYKGSGNQEYGKTDRSHNPNALVATRGRLLVFGSITQKKRGVIGVSNRSYDKDFRFDRRLLTLAPPLFPSSTNVIVRTVRPFSLNPHDPATRYPYRTTAQSTGGLTSDDPLWFMSQMDI